MPAAVPFTLGVLAGLAAGLLEAARAWWLAPCCALAASLAWRRAAPLAVACTGAAAAVLWGAAAAHERDNDCRLRWAEGARIALVVEPRDLAVAGRVPLHTVRRVVESGARTHRACAAAGAIRLVVSRRARLSDGPALVEGTWHREPPSPRHRLSPERAGRLVVASAVPAADAPSLRARLRHGAERRLLALFGERRAPLATALTVSAEVALPRELRDGFARAGLVHLLSISGFHVGVLAGVLILLLRAARVGPDGSRLLGTLLVALYVWMLGFPAPAVRAAALVGLWAVGRARQRHAEWRAALAVTALVVCAVDPWAVFGIGPWLSFTGIYGCIVAERWTRRLREAARTRGARRRIALAGPVGASVAASLVTAPITIAAFGTATPAGIAANLLAVPVAAFAVPALALTLALDLLPGALGNAVAAAAASATGLSLDLLDWITATAGRLPVAQLAFADRPFAALAVGVAAVIVLRPPPAPPGPARAAAIAARGVLATACVLALVVWRPGIRDGASGYRPGWLTLHFLAVGQGDAIVARTPKGRWLLVDGGPRVPGSDAGARIVAPFLERRGARTLEVVAASHGDADHLGGLPAVLAHTEVRMVLEPGEALPRALYREWLAAVAAEGAAWRAARAGDRITLDGVALRVWHPDSAFLARRLPANENSVVLTLEFGAFRVLLTGDAGLPMERERGGAIGPVTMLKVGHHGSAGASGAEWLRALRPLVCVIPVGPNRYGHPTPRVLATLAAAPCAVWRTDRDGTITVATDGRAVRITAGARDTTFFVRELP